MKSTGALKISILGASGATGLLLTERSLAAGYTVTALVRTPASYRYTARVHVVEGNAFDPAAVHDTVAGADAVFSALGARSLGKEDVLERAVPILIEQMNVCGVHRLITLGSSGALDSALDKQPAYRRWIVENLVYKTMLKWPVASQRAQYAALAASTLDWTMVMPPMLRNVTARGNLRIDPDALPRNASQISRADVADFMIGQLRDSQFHRRGVYIAW